MTDLDLLLELVNSHTLDHLDTPCCDICVKINSLKSKLESKLENEGGLYDIDKAVNKITELTIQIKELQEQVKDYPELVNENAKYFEENQDLKQKLKKIEELDINWLYLFGVLRLHETESPMKKIVEELDDLKSILERYR